MAVIRGICNCESIELSIPASAFPSTTILCHCLNCRKAGGTMSSANIVVSTKEITLLKGTPKTFNTEGTSGAWAVRSFCGNCGSPVFTIVEGKEDAAFVKAGFFPVGKVPPVGLELFCKNKESWEKEIEGVTGLYEQ